MRQKGSILLLIPVVVILILSGIGWFLIKNNQITILPSPSAAGETTANWKTYRNEKYGFEFKYPNQYLIKESPEIITLDDGSNDNTITAKKPITIEKLEIPQSETYKEFLIKNTILNASGKNPSSFDNFSEQRIGQNTFYYIETGRFEGVLSSTYYLVKGTFIYKFGVVSYIGAKWQDPNFKETDDIHYQNLNQILSTFKFIDNNETKYTCPKGGWVNCMPILTEEAKKGCSPQALEWYKKNCPDFEGIAQ
jgi:hypothetical protein